MAKILLNVELGKSNVLKNLKELEAGIKGIATSLGDVKVNKNLTAQLNALTKNYRALASAAKEAQKIDNKQAVQDEKLLKIQAQKRTALINEQRAKIQLAKATETKNKVEKEEVTISTDGTAAIKKKTQSLISMLPQILKWQIAMTLVMKPLRILQDGLESLNETLVKTEDAVISIQRVLNDDSLSNQNISDKLYDLAQRYGQTFDNVNDIAQNFARTGMSWVETIKATEAALLALNVAELDASQASDGMIAIMQQFGYEASELTGIIDMLNKTADNYAVTTDKLLTALQRTGSSASNANLSLAETVGLITALSEATGRSGENLGTAINSLIQYSSKEASLDTFASLNSSTQDIVEKYRKGGATILDVWTEVSNVINNMDSRQESILSSLANSEDIQNLQQELQDELGDIFEQVNDVYGTANTFRKNYFIALLGNMQTVQSAIETASDASGYSAKENQKYLDTYTAKVNTLKAKWEELANDEQGLLAIKKAFVDFANGALNFIDSLGGIKVLLTEIGIIVGTIIATAKGAAIVAGLTKVFKLIRSLTIDALPNAVVAWKTYAAGVVSANTAIQASLPIIGLLLMGITAVVGAVNSWKEAEEERRQKSIENYKNTKEEIGSLEDLYARYKELNSFTNKTAEENEELKDVESQLVDILDDKYKKLSELTKGTDEYRVALEKLSEEELNSLISARGEARAAAKETLLNTNMRGSILYDNDYSEDDIDALLKAAGISTTTYYRHGWKTPPKEKYKLEGVGSGGDLDERLQTYAIFNNALSVLNKEAVKRESAFDLEGAEAIYNSDAYKNFSNAVSSTKNAVEAYLQLSLDTYLDAFGNITSQDEYNKFIEFALGKEGLLGTSQESFYREYFNELIGGVEKFVKVQGDAVDSTKTWEEQSKETLSNYEKIVEVIDKSIKSQKDAVELEEKKVALQEKEIELEKAKQALEDARRQKNVRVYNAQTGTWELQANKHNIQNAEDSLKKAQDAVDKAKQDLENAVWSNLKNELENNNLTVGEIYEKVKEIASSVPNLANIIRDALVAQGYNVPAFDSGGVLNGLGGIKATTSDEIVLGPNLTRKILQPTSNAQFSAFVRDLGLLFGTSKQLYGMQNGMISNYGGASSNDNRQYNINGVPIPKEMAETHTIVELFEAMDSLPN